MLVLCKVVGDGSAVVWWAGLGSGRCLATSWGWGLKALAVG
jgi:hypothetical protein